MGFDPGLGIQGNGVERLGLFGRKVQAAGAFRRRPFLHKRIPGTAIRTTAQPFGGLVTAALANKDYFGMFSQY
jgi:hypothetical protein